MSLRIRLTMLGLFIALPISGASRVDWYAHVTAAPQLTDLSGVDELQTLFKRCWQSTAGAVGVAHVTGVCGWHPVGADGVAGEVSEGEPARLRDLVQHDGERFTREVAGDALTGFARHPSVG